MEVHKTAVRTTIALSIFSILARLIPHLPNFAPVGALALMAGVYGPKRWGVIFPISVMLISDYFIGFYDLRLAGVVYGSFVLMYLLGRMMKNAASFSNTLLVSLGGSVIFYLATNFAVWLFSGWYSPEPGGLLYSYLLALPFFKNTLMGNLFYATAFYGVYALALKNYPVGGYLRPPALILQPRKFIKKSVLFKS